MASQDPILLIGGSGTVGRWTARFLREAHPQIPLLIAGRDRAKAEAFAREIGDAEGVAVDLAADDLLLGDRPVSAVALFLKDDRIGGLRFAQSRGVPCIGISSTVNDFGPEVAAFIHRPSASPVVLGAEWLVGATTVPTLHFARDFGRVDRIVIGALLDEEDTGGPTTASDLKSLAEEPPPALVRRDGLYQMVAGDDARSSFQAVDGTAMAATALSANDVAALANATAAPNVRFSFAIGVSSSRRRGGPMSTEIVIELEGEDREGRPLRTRNAVVHSEGQMPLTGFGVAMVLERLLGLDGTERTPAGLYFPHQLLDSDAYLARLERMGGRLERLETA